MLKKQQHWTLKGYNCTTYESEEIDQKRNESDPHEWWKTQQEQLGEIYENEGGYLCPYGYVYKQKCMICDEMFYSRSQYSKYCCYQCYISARVQRRREIHGFKRWKGPCQYCNKEFVSSRIHAKYCCESHRVLACLKRRRKRNTMNF